MAAVRGASGDRAAAVKPAPFDPASVLSESDYESFKIFAGGLNRATTSEGLAEHFGKYGQVVHTEIVGDKTTGKSRGFGFVTFASEEAVKEVLSHSHKIDNVLVDVKRAVRKEKSKDLILNRDDSSRIFIGGIAESISDDHFREYFSKYGKIVSYNYLYDKGTNKPRGFGFVIYENPQDCEKALGPHTSLGRNCEAKRAQPRPSTVGSTATASSYGTVAYSRSAPNVLPSAANAITAATTNASGTSTTATATATPEGYDYAAYNYAQYMMYNPYFAQLYANNQMPQMAYLTQMAAQGQFPYMANWATQTDDGQQQQQQQQQPEVPQVPEPPKTKNYDAARTHPTAKGGNKKAARAEPY